MKYNITLEIKERKINLLIRGKNILILGRNDKERLIILLITINRNKYKLYAPTIIVASFLYSTTIIHVAILYHENICYQLKMLSI